MQPYDINLAIITHFMLSCAFRHILTLSKPSVASADQENRVQRENSAAEAVINDFP